MAASASIQEKEDKKRFILELIEMYHSLTALWNINSSEYNDRYKKEEQYEILLQKYRERYPIATRKELCRKINSLRTNYKREINHASKLKRNGCNVSLGTKLWYFDAISFISDMRVEPKPPFVWTKESILKLLEEVEQKPCIWKKSDPMNTNKYVKKAALEKIAPKIGASADEIKDKIRSLRTIFFQNCKKILKNGNGTDRTPKWEFYNAMLFMAGEETTAGESDSIEEEPKRKKIRLEANNSTDEGIRLIPERFKKPQNVYNKLGEVWALKLQEMEKNQALIAEKLIHEIIFNGSMGCLDMRTSVINYNDESAVVQNPIEDIKPYLAHEMFIEEQ